MGLTAWQKSEPQISRISSFHILHIDWWPLLYNAILHYGVDLLQLKKFNLNIKHVQPRKST